MGVMLLAAGPAARWYCGSTARTRPPAMAAAALFERRFDEDS
jgi:hypothetical protein